MTTLNAESIVLTSVKLALPSNARRRRRLATTTHSRFSILVSRSVFSRRSTRAVARFLHEFAIHVHIIAHIYIYYIYIFRGRCVCVVCVHVGFSAFRDFFRNRAFLSSRGIFLKLVSFDDFVVSNCGEVVITLCGLFCY